MPLIHQRLDLGQSVKFSPRGTSMLPMLREGRDCVILSSPPDRLKKYDVALYQRINGQYVLHRVVKVKGDGYVFAGDNQFTYEYGLDHTAVIAVMTAFTREQKHHSVHSFAYGTYCHLWHWTRFPRHVVFAIKWRLCRLLRRTNKKKE